MHVVHVRPSPACDDGSSVYTPHDDAKSAAATLVNTRPTRYDDDDDDDDDASSSTVHGRCRLDALFTPRRRSVTIKGRQIQFSRCDLGEL